jgi:hypothetical protein
MNFDLGPVGLDRAFHKLSNNITFAKFGLVDFVLLNFEIGSSMHLNELKKKRIQTNGPARENKRAGARERGLGQPSYASGASGPPDRWGEGVSGS